MKKEFLVVFPSSGQLSYLSTLELSDKTVYIILQKANEKVENKASRVIFTNKDDEMAIQILQKKELYVLCCHEEALFWVRIHASISWEYPFNSIYFTLLEKQYFKQFVKENNINIGQYYFSAEDIKSFPVIAKPSIGFGSIGVQILYNECMCEDYSQSFKSAIGSSGIYEYQKTYFSDKTNKCIFEIPIEGDFFRTPFIVESNKCKYIFPIQGVSKRSKKNTDYNWVEFEYSFEKTFDADEKINYMHNQLVETLGLDDGVYISEFIVSENNIPFLLEFSPRQPTGRISKVIYLATGINLEIEAIHYFFKRPAFKQNPKENQVRLRLQSSPNQFTPLEGFELIEEEVQASLHDEQIKCMYYKKKIRGN